MNYLKPFTDSIKLYYFKKKKRAKVTIKINDCTAVTYLFAEEELDKLVDGWNEEVNVKAFGTDVFVGVKGKDDKRFVRISTMGQFGMEHRVTVGDMINFCRQYEIQKSEPQDWD